MMFDDWPIWLLIPTGLMGIGGIVFFICQILYYSNWRR